jgi:hypothetical protein
VADELIRTRCVVSIGDYEPSDIAQQFARFLEELQCFATTWNVTVRYSQVKMEPNGSVAVWRVEAKGPNWKVDTEFRLLNWSDLVKKDFCRWSFQRIWRAVRALFDFLISGTCWHYLLKSWRFGLLFLYPALMALLFTAAAFWLALQLRGLGVPFALLAGLIIGAGLFVAFVKWIDPFDLPRVVDMWIFLYDLVHLERAELAARLGVFSQEIVAKLSARDFDEIVIVGHGIGAALQPIIVDRAFWALPEFGKDGRSISLLSLDSLLLAVGLHPQGAWLVPPTLRIASDRMVFWAEYQAEEDILGFQGRNPVTELGSSYGKPILQNVRIKDMVEAAAKRRFPGAIYQNHLRLLRANTKKYFYDYFMICCGPFALPTRIKYPNLMVAVFDPDGRLVPIDRKYDNPSR